MTADVALTLGDPNGIGPEIAIKAASRLVETGKTSVVLVGDPHVIHHYMQRLAIDRSLAEFSNGATRPGALCYLPVESLPEAAFCPGQISAEAGRATVDYVSAAIRFVEQGYAQSVVACPHSETSVNAAGIPFSGYPSLLARLKGIPEDHVFLMLAGAGLRVVHVTLHERLQTALARISCELVERAARTAIACLHALAIENPTIGVFGINPHAGENGLFGHDDERITVPVVEKLKSEGLRIEGPVGADLMLGRREFDAFVAMYHDQGHIPVKLLAGRHCAAMSIGAGVTFASVGHGSAFDIAGRGIAEPDGVLRSIQLVGGSTRFEGSAER